jgi:hypothetical protein
MTRNFWILILVVCFPLLFVAQTEVKLSTATDKNQYFDSEYVYYSFIIENADIKQVTQPQFDGFQLIDTKVRSNSSSSLIIINGKRVNKSEDKYEIIFILKPLKRGSLVLPEAEITYNGKVYKAPGKQVFIKKLNVPEDDIDKDHFVVVECSNYNPYQGESFTLTYTIFSQFPLQEEGQFITRNPFINFGDFNFKELDRFGASTMMIKGKQYYTIQFQSHLLSAIKSGKKEIPSFPIEYATFRVINDGWFGRRERIDKKVFTPKVTINVRALPTSNSEFSGLVGDFKIKIEVDKNSLNINDALTVRYILSGAGNFEILKSVSPDFPANWEIFDPTINEQTTISTLGKKGKKTYEYVVIPRKPGTYTIPSFTLHYFNPTIGLYQKTLTESVNVQVGGDGENSVGKVLFSGTQSTKVEAVDEEIRFLKTDFVPQKKIKDYLPESKWFSYALLLGSIFWLILSFLPWIVRFFPDKMEQRKNKVQQIIKEFNMISKKENLKGNEVMMLWEKYWISVFNLNKSKQSLADLTEMMENSKISDDLILKTKQVINDLTRSQYAGGNININSLAKNSIEIIKLIEEEFLLANDQDEN